MKFTDLHLDEQLIEAMSYMGFENATPIQEQAIPLILENKDLLACAQTGTGKTGAFVLPILNKLVKEGNNGTNTLIIVPTRELAIQIEQLIQGLSYFTEIASIAIYGGGDAKDWDTQKNALEAGVDIVVATPGKLLSLLKSKYGKFENLKHYVLDEADRMLDMGFEADLKAILSFLPKKKQTLLFSATMPNKIEKLAKAFLNDPSEIKLSISKPAKAIDQKTYLTYDNQKTEVIKHVLKEREEYTSIIVFTSAKSKISEIVRSLNKAGFPAEGISSDLDQKQRESVLSGFRSKKIRIIVATDVMSRGIDIKEINMVINYDVPHDAEDYVHRIGRTARANTKGEAITFINPKDMLRFKKIEELIESEIVKLQPPEEIGEGPEWNTGKGKPRSSNGSRKKPSKSKFKARENTKREDTGAVKPRENVKDVSGDEKPSKKLQKNPRNKAVDKKETVATETLSNSKFKKRENVDVSVKPMNEKQPRKNKPNNKKKSNVAKKENTQDKNGNQSKDNPRNKSKNSGNKNFKNKDSKSKHAKKDTVKKPVEKKQSSGEVVKQATKGKYIKPKQESFFKKVLKRIGLKS